MKTNEVCKKLGISKKALRVYEEAGLISARRNENNYREYDESDLVRIKNVQVLRELGFSLSDIQEIMLKIKGDSNEFLLQLFYMQLKTTEYKISQLNNIRRALTDNINFIMSDDYSAEKLTDKIINNLDIQSYDDFTGSIIKRWNFDEMAHNYILNHLMGDSVYPTSIEAGRRLLSTYDKNTSIIDIGGGNGYIWWALPHRNLTILDKSVEMLKEAKKHLPYAQVVANDIIETDFWHYDSYELVTAIFLLHHIDYQHQKYALKNILSFMDKKGSTIIIDRCFRNSKERIDYLANCNDEERKTIYQEFYLYLDDILPYISYKGFMTKVSQISDYIYILEITR